MQTEYSVCCPLESQAPCSIFNADQYQKFFHQTHPGSNQNDQTNSSNSLN